MPRTKTNKISGLPFSEGLRKIRDPKPYTATLPQHHSRDESITSYRSDLLLNFAINLVEKLGEFHVQNMDETTSIPLKNYVKGRYVKPQLVLRNLPRSNEWRVQAFAGLIELTEDEQDYLSLIKDSDTSTQLLYDENEVGDFFLVLFEVYDKVTDTHTNSIPLVTKLRNWEWLAYQNLRNLVPLTLPLLTDSLTAAMRGSSACKRNFTYMLHPYERIYPNLYKAERDPTVLKLFNNNCLPEDVRRNIQEILGQKYRKKVKTRSKKRSKKRSQSKKKNLKE